MSQTKAQLIDTLVASLLPASDSSVDIGSNGVRFANIYGDTLYGDGSNLTGITSTTINNNADNRLITGSGSANTLNGESGLTFDGTTLDLTATSGKITINSTGPALHFIDTNADSDFMAQADGGLFKLVDLTNSDATRLVLNSSGKVGINETNPSEMLHIKAEDNTDSFGGLIIKANNNSVHMKYGWRGLDANNGGDIRFAVNGTELMRILSSGKVGLGRTSADEMLHIKADDNTDGFGGLKIDANNGSIQCKYGWLGVDGSNSFRIGVAGTERMRVASDGKVGIGMTPSSGTGYILQLESGQAQTFMSFGNTGTGNGALNGLVVGNDSSRAYFTQRENQPIHIATNNVDRIAIDATGKVGIGTTSPTQPIHVLSTTNPGILSRNDSGGTGLRMQSDSGSACSLSFSDLDAHNQGLVMYHHADNRMQFNTNGSERIRIDSVGAMLVGHSTSRNNFTSAVSSEHAPIIQLEGTNQKRILSITAVSNSDGGSLILARQNGSVGQNTAVSSGQQVGKIDFQGSGGTNMEVAARISADCDGTPGDNDMPGRLCFKTTADGASSPSEHMRIHSGGQVSMGLSSTYTSVNHDYQLVVTPNITDSSKGGLGILIDGEHGTSGGASVDSISLKVKNTNTWNNATHQYGGYFEVNQQLLQPQTGVYSQATGLYNVQKCFSAQLNKNINAVTTGISYYSNIVQTGSGGAAYHAQFFDNGTEKLQIRLGGNILNANNTYGSLSDVKLKENIVDANSQWDDIKGLKIRNFNFKNDPDKVKMLGVIAQEAETVSAGLIETNDDIEINDETGEGTKTGTTKYVKYSILYMKSVKALQEAMTRIETLETKVAALEAA